MINTTPLNLLVIEDNEGDLELFKETLESSMLRYSVCHADRMEPVEELVKKTLFDLAFLDLSLPDSKGIDTFTYFHRLAPHIPVVILSGLSDMNIALEALSLGAQDYLVKGEFDEKLLLKTTKYSIEREKTLKKLRFLNERYELVSKATQDIIFEWDIHTNEVSWTDTIPPDGSDNKPINSNLAWFTNSIHPDDRTRVVNNLKNNIRKRILYQQDQFRFLCCDGNYRHVFGRGYMMLDAAGQPYRMVGAMTDVTERIKFQEKITEQQLKQQRLVSEATIQTQEKERNEIGKELHDNINQILATVRMYLEISINRNGITEDLIVKSYEYVNQSIEEIRKLSRTLVTPTLDDIGLIEALQELVDDINIARNLTVHLFTEFYEGKKIDKNLELVLYRIVQEQMNNISKYANATNVVIEVRSNGILYLAIKDNGAGFDPTAKSKGIGLKNIRNRVQFYSGSVNVISKPGKGCTVEVQIPLNQDN